MLVGVDAGGTSTRAVLLDESGRCLGYGTAGGGNPVSWGPERAARAIASAMTAAIEQGRAIGEPVRSAGGAVPAGDTGIAVLAMAGGSAFSGSDAISSELQALGLRCTVTLASDLLATFCSGTAALDGYAIVAGTGAAAIRVREGRVDASSDGLGWLLGDAGSGFWIGHRVARAALAALDGRGPQTSLTGMVLRDLGIADDGRLDASGRPAAVQAAIDILYRWRPVELSRFAALAFRAANPAAGGGDAVAASILAAARDRLVGVLDAVRRIDIAGPVVLGGGIARRLPGLTASMIDASARTGAEPEVVTVADGAVGAGVLALRHVGITVDRQIFDRLRESVRAIRERHEGSAEGTQLP